MYTKECNSGECSSCMNPSDCACGCHVHPDNLLKHPLSEEELEQFRLPDEHVEVVEWIEGGRVVKKTVNGIAIPPEMLDPLPTVVYQKLYMTRKEVEHRYGKKFL